MRPTHIYHADWGTAASKRWLARAKLGSDGRYAAEAPKRVADHTQLIPSIRCDVGSQGCAVVGFDFPIGVPERYASAAGIEQFKSFLKLLGSGLWVDFLNCAKVPGEISIHRPFYPSKPGGTRQRHLLEALGLKNIDDLRRQCEKKQTGRRAACALFWTLGANQVGKAAIIGWQDVLLPALRDDEFVFFWPFDGGLEDLLKTGNIVIVETYPAECYRWFFSGPLKGKGKLEVRQKAGAALLEWAATAGIDLEAAMVRAINDGFPEGDDAFDAAVGLFGILAVVSGQRAAGEPNSKEIKNLEGWIFGQA